MKTENEPTPGAAQAQEMHDEPRATPRVDIYENEEEYLILADVPGSSEDAIRVDLHQGELVLAASRSAVEEGTALLREFDPLPFRRTFRVPDSIDANAVSAKVSRGVLTVHLPKSAAVRPRKIPVRAG